jgi:hypothetical protein
MGSEKYGQSENAFVSMYTTGQGTDSMYADSRTMNTTADNMYAPTDGYTAVTSGYDDGTEFTPAKPESTYTYAKPTDSIYTSATGVTTAYPRYQVTAPFGKLSHQSSYTTC